MTTNEDTRDSAHDTTGPPQSGGARFLGATNADSRTSYTTTYLQTSAIFARRALELEASNPAEPIEEVQRVEHQGAALAAIMHSAAALESELYEIVVYGPGHHLGSNGTDHRARAFLSPMADILLRGPVLERYSLVLHVLEKDPLNRRGRSWSNAKLLVMLRNEIVHYKSRWGSDREKEKMVRGLQALALPKPPFVSEHARFFPTKCVSGACAAWATRSSLDFLSDFYTRLGFTDRLKRVADVVNKTLAGG